MTISSAAESTRVSAQKRVSADGAQTWVVPLSDILVDDELEQAVLEAVRSGWWSMGPRVAELELQFSRFCGVRHALAVANGTAALHLALLAVGCGPRDEVLVAQLRSGYKHDPPHGRQSCLL